MTRHLLRLIWNRKRQNLLLTIEIFFSFLVVFGVVLFAAALREQRARSRSATTSIACGAIDVVGRTRDRPGPEDAAAAKARAARDLSAGCWRRCASCRRSRSSAGAFTGPYANASWGSGLTLAGGRKVDYGVQPRDRRLHRRCCRCPIVAGRVVLARGRRGHRWTPVLINRRDGADDLRRRQPDRPDHPRGDATRTSRADPDETRRRSQARRRRDRGLPPERRALDAAGT